MHLANLAKLANGRDSLASVVALAADPQAHSQRSITVNVCAASRFPLKQTNADGFGDMKREKLIFLPLPSFSFGKERACARQRLHWN
ncbi:hypothetical protein T05_12486 [Trichinella murrelli]|uniref:Uncharacterized protein n=1 Tax=Trichinella murrelli TaxID=144512 RepID=A0A0V0UCH3_9BILA|nr:hypothetical protein T05_12486 [Trichinella murrelli]